MTTFTATGLPPLGPLERDAFDRQRMVPGHDQELLTGKHITLIGAGGLGSWSGLGNFRSAQPRERCSTKISSSDPICHGSSIMKRTSDNPRQFASPATCCPMRRLAAVITGIATTWEDALEQCAVPSDLLSGRRGQQPLPLGGKSMGA